MAKQNRWNVYLVPISDESLLLNVPDNSFALALRRQLGNGTFEFLKNASEKNHYEQFSQFVRLNS